MESNLPKVTDDCQASVTGHDRRWLEPHGAHVEQNAVRRLEDWGGLGDRGDRDKGMSVTWAARR